MGILPNEPLIHPGAPGFHHLVADFRGVSEAQLRDAPLLTGLAIAAAGALGVAAIGTPVRTQRPEGGLTTMLLLEGCHIAAHSFPERGLLLLDVLAYATHDVRRALEVFARRLPATEVRHDIRERG